MDLPKKMRRKALFSALSSKLAEGELKVLSGLEKVAPKTKAFVAMMKNLGFDEKKTKLLLVIPSDLQNVKRAGRNVIGVNFSAASRLNAYDVLKHKQLVVMKEAITEMEKFFLPKE
jgi:large subunit ribosomal protein L4